MSTELCVNGLRQTADSGTIKNVVKTARNGGIVLNKHVLASVLLNGVGTNSLSINPLIKSVVTDSRQAAEGCVFVCIKGERVDGHDYAQQAVSLGAVCVVAQRYLNGVDESITLIVGDPLDAMIKIGENYRDLFAPVLIGVTGSVGKTTTKEYCYAVFSEFGKTLKTQGNKNNEIGMPNTLFELEDSTKYAVIEMGMQGLGEIEKLSLAAKPNAAIITQIGTAHMQQLKTRENICKAKLEICKGMNKGAIIAINGDDDLPKKEDIPTHVNPVFFAIKNKNADVVANEIRFDENGTFFDIEDKLHGTISAFIPAIGAHNVMDALSAYAIATRLGLNAKKAAKALSAYKTTGLRQNIVKFKGITVIEDCYNANPDSVKAAITAMYDYKAKGAKIAVLGDMLELGEASKQEHEQIGVFCSEYQVDVLITVGEQMRAAHNKAHGLGIEAMRCDTNEIAAQLLCDVCKEGDIVLIKASRGMVFEEIIKYFYENYK